ncbi:MAG TPA: 3-hydroxyacyl-CoA dehydrogenase NAD-binding domain-containing protein [Candidatus Angelobacter sp.]|jgi:3-hydroxybutyryl-CoA dehydrogenase
MAEIRTIAVIGAGTLGREIAYASVLGGYRTILEDILPASLRNAAAELRERLTRGTNVGSVSEAEATAAFSRLQYAATVEQAAREADLVIEAVPDEMESKIEIFTLLDKICKPATILASNTASLSVTEIASVTYRAPKVLGMRFANGAATKLLEMVRGRETSDETIASCAEVARRLGREVVVVADR